MDMQLIGETTAKLMDDLPDEAEGEVVAVGIVVVVDDANSDGTYTKIKTTHDRFYEQLGLFHAAIDVARSGLGTDDDD